MCVCGCHEGEPMTLGMWWSDVMMLVLVLVCIKFIRG